MRSAILFTNKKDQIMDVSKTKVKLESKRRLLTWVADHTPDEVIEMIWEMEGYKVEKDLKEEDYE